MSSLVVPKDQIDLFRQEFLTELPSLAREYVDTARSEGTTASYEKVMNTALKVIEGLEVEKKKDVYANLPVIHVSFGPGMQMTTEVVPEPVVPDEVTDVTPKSPFASSASKDFGTLPDNPLDLLSGPEPASEEDDDTLRALSLAGSAMALD